MVKQKVAACQKTKRVMVEKQFAASQKKYRDLVEKNKTRIEKNKLPQVRKLTAWLEISLGILKRKVVA